MSDDRELQMAEATLFDKRRIPILRGDIVKVYHFTAARRRQKYYMYKQCLGLQSFKKGGATYLMFSHLNFIEDREDRNGPYHETPDGRVMADYEIVQSIKSDHEDRPRPSTTDPEASGNPISVQTNEEIER